MFNKLFNELVSIEKDLKNDENIISYHYIIKYNELDRKIFINVFDDVNKYNELYSIIKNVNVSDFVNILTILYNNYYTNNNYDKYKNIFNKLSISNDNIIIS